MNRHLFHKLIGLALLVMFVAGCDTASVEPADIISPDGYPVATFTTDATDGTYAEGDTIYYTVTIDKQMDTDISFSARVIGGDATDADIEVATGVIEAYTNSTEVMVVIARDDDAEETETATIEFGAYSVATRYLLNPSTVNTKLEVSIENWESPALLMEFSWDKDVIVNPNYPDYPDHRDTYHAGSEVDLDIFVADGDGYDNADPWATVNYVAFAATGGEPEEMTFDGLDDGVYVIFADLWSNEFADSAWLATGYGYTVDQVSLPITATFIQQGVQSATIVQDDSQVITTATEAGSSFIAEVEIDGTTYTIRDFEGATVLKGAKAGTRLQFSKRPAELMK